MTPAEVEAVSRSVWKVANRYARFSGLPSEELYQDAMVLLCEREWDSSRSAAITWAANFAVHAAQMACRRARAKAENEWRAREKTSLAWSEASERSGVDRDARLTLSWLIAHVRLTAGEAAVIAALATGDESDAELARRLGVSKQSVNKRKQDAFRKIREMMEKRM